MPFYQEELGKLHTNKDQKKAYLSDGHCIVLAGPGSGKTATLSLKLLRLLELNIHPPQGLACLTFNNEAVREFRNRLRLLGLPKRPNIFLGTVHSFCLSAVIKPFAKLFMPELPYPLQMLPEIKREVTLQKAMDVVGVTEKPQNYKFQFDRYRRTHLDRSSEEWHANEELANVIENYENILRAGGYIDFDDLILISLQIIKEEAFVRKCLYARYPWLIIDEYQDLGAPLHNIVTTLLDNTDIKIFAVGDPDQSIYSFIGADPKYLTELAEREEIESIRLQLNYRSGQTIIDSADTILAPAIPRAYKAARGSEYPGEIFFIEKTEGYEAQIKYIIDEIIPSLDEAGYERHNIAILYHTTNDAEILTTSLNSAGIQYSGEKDQRYKRTPVTRWVENMAQWCCGLAKDKGLGFNDIFSFWLNLKRNAGVRIDTKEELKERSKFFSLLSAEHDRTKSVESWLQVIDEGLDLRRVLSCLKIRPEELDNFCEMLAACNNGPLSDFLLEDLAGCGSDSKSLVITTLHSSKGLQFDVVIIPAMEEGVLPRFSATSDEAVKEARRTFYVAFTRTRHVVYILYSGWYANRYGKRFSNGPSRFVAELQKTLQ